MFIISNDNCVSQESIIEKVHIQLLSQFFTVGDADSKTTQSLDRKQLLMPVDRLTCILAVLQ